MLEQIAEALINAAAALLSPAAQVRQVGPGWKAGPELVVNGDVQDVAAALRLPVTQDVPGFIAGRMRSCFSSAASGVGM